MANDYCQSSTAVAYKLTDEEIEWIEQQTNVDRLRDQVRMRNGNKYLVLTDWYEDENYAEGPLPFHSEIDNRVWYLYEMENFHIEPVKILLQAYLNKFRPDEVISIQWAFVCDKPRPDSFSGGAAVISADECRYYDLNSWVCNTMEAMYSICAKGNPPSEDEGR